MKRRSVLPVALIALVLASALGGYWLGGRRMTERPAAAGDTATPSERRVLYWYDPMYPQQHFDRPGQSPFMDMALVPRYADEGPDTTGVRIDPRAAQNLGLRLATVRRGVWEQTVEAAGVLALNGRDRAVVQARTEGYVERVYARAPGDVVAAGAPLVDVLVPQWAAAQEEFLALRRSGTPELIAAAGQRLRLAGLPPALIERLERGGTARPVITIASPIAGVVQTLAVRTGMAVSAGQTLAEINGLDPLWLEVAVPEAQAGAVQPGQPAEALLPARPGDVVRGTVDAVLPQANPDSRTLRVRVVLPNPDGRLRPGLTARVRIAQATDEPVLLVPSEAVIRTGQRDLVMVAEPDGRFHPVAVRLGPESGDSAVVLAGLEAGQQVVASGQFLLDSEASLRGLNIADAPAAETARMPALHEASGHIEAITADGITLRHGPFETLGMPGMTMTFPLATPGLATSLKVGDDVRVGVRESDAGLVIERIEKLGGRP